MNEKPDKGIKMDKKKLAAAITAVFAHIKTSEEAMAHAALQAGGLEAVDAAMTPVDVRLKNIWGITGRQNQMQANTMIQMRMFK